MNVSVIRSGRRSRRSGMASMVWSSVIGLSLILGLAGAVARDTPSAGAPQVSWGRGSWAYDVSDDTRLVGSSSNVFFGTVLSSEPALPLIADSDPTAMYPRTAYTVQPESNIKGQLTAPVTVIQLGGIDTDGTVRLMEGDSLLSVGFSYLLVTRAIQDLPETYVSRAEGPSIYALIAPGYDHDRIDSTAERTQLESRFEAARQNEADPYLELE